MCGAESAAHTQGYFYNRYGLTGTAKRSAKVAGTSRAVAVVCRLAIEPPSKVLCVPLQLGDGNRLTPNWQGADVTPLLTRVCESQGRRVLQPA